MWDVVRLLKVLFKVWSKSSITGGGLRQCCWFRRFPKHLGLYPPFCFSPLPQSWLLEFLRERALSFVPWLLSQIITRRVAGVSEPLVGVCCCLQCCCLITGLSVLSVILRAERHVASGREGGGGGKWSHTDSYNDQWCLTEGDVSNYVCPSLVANKSMPSCPENVKWRPPRGFERRSGVRLFPKWLEQKAVVLPWTAAIHQPANPPPSKKNADPRMDVSYIPGYCAERWAAHLRD